MGFEMALPIVGSVIEYLGDRAQGESNRSAAESANLRNLDLARQQMVKQEDFAKHGLSWRVQDAIDAGLHPLAALGTNASQFSPVSASIMPEVSDSKGAFARFGQNLSRSYVATASEDERIASKLRLENMRLQNKLLEGQITSINNPSNPPMPVAGSSNFVDGQGNSGAMVVRPSERTASQAGREAQEAGWRPDVSYSRTDTGLVPVIPRGLSESLEDDLIGQILWRIRNQVAPNFGRGGKPPVNQLPRGADHWRWDKFNQQFVPGTTRRRSFGREVYEKFRYGR